jgi:hypothetical protein
VTEDATFRDALRQSLDVAEVDVQAHAALAPRADVIVVDAEAAPVRHDEVHLEDDSVTIVVAPEIDAEVRERGRALNASAYVRKDDGLYTVMGLVIELASYPA